MASRKKQTAQTELQEDAAVNETVEKSAEKAAAKEKPIVPKDIDQNMIIPVINAFPGKLVYVSQRTGEMFTWEELGDEQDMELKELRNIKSSAKAFFINGWISFSDEYAWVVKYLGLEQFYKQALSLEEFQEIFDRSPAEIKKIIAGLSAGQKQSVAYMAREKVISGEIDSRKVIQAFEEALGVELIER